LNIITRIREREVSQNIRLSLENEEICFFIDFLLEPKAEICHIYFSYDKCLYKWQPFSQKINSSADIFRFQFSVRKGLLRFKLLTRFENALFFKGG